MNVKQEDADEAAKLEDLAAVVYQRLEAHLMKLRRRRREDAIWISKEHLVLEDGKLRLPIRGKDPMPPPSPVTERDYPMLRWQDQLDLTRRVKALLERCLEKSLPPTRVGRLSFASRRFSQSEADPVIYADDVEFRPGVPPFVSFFTWDGGRHVTAVLLGARAPDLILCEYGWLHVPTPDPDLISRAETFGGPFRRVLLSG